MKRILRNQKPTLIISYLMELENPLSIKPEWLDHEGLGIYLQDTTYNEAYRRNVAWDEAAQEIVVKGYVNLGIAAATPRGLIVPNVKDADLMTLHDLAGAIGALTATAREGRTQPAEMSGGTITITNVVFGVDTGTPILNLGEAAIMALGVIRKQPWVVTAADGSDEPGHPPGHLPRDVLRPPARRRRASGRAISPTSRRSSPRTRRGLLGLGRPRYQRRLNVVRGTAD